MKALSRSRGCVENSNVIWYESMELWYKATSWLLFPTNFKGFTLPYPFTHTMKQSLLVKQDLTPDGNDGLLSTSHGLHLASWWTPYLNSKVVSTPHCAYGQNPEVKLDKLGRLVIAL